MASEMFGKTYIVKVLDDGECITEGELIRCRDCKHHANVRDGFCILFARFGAKENDYCSQAERKEE